MASISDESRKEFGELFDEVSRILYRHDPMSLARCGAPADEYDIEASTILSRLNDCNTAHDSRKVIHEEFAHWFGANLAGAEETYDDAAHEIWDAWQNRPMNRAATKADSSLRSE